MRSAVLLILVLVFAIGCECNASEVNKECYPLENIMKDSYMRGTETCKYLDLEGFCTFTSQHKTGGGMNYTHTAQIPCYQFETYKVIHNCTIENQDAPESERYTLTRECITSRTCLIKK